MFFAKIPVVTIMYDNGNGGYSTYVYNNEDELIADHRRSDEMTPELREEILSGNDEYENGYIGKRKIEVLVDGEKVTLLAPICFSAGQ
jgi:hypothetical protein